MSFRRVGWFTAMLVAMLILMSCGEVYRPVVIPISNNPPNPANPHAVFGISTNVAPNPGTVLQIDVSGDSNIGVARMGINPTHAAIQLIGSSSRIFVSSAGSVVNGDPDVITAFNPAFSSGIASPVTFSLPNVGPNQSSAITAISESGNVVTVTLASAIGEASVGGPIVISGVSIGGYDGNFVISSIAGATIQYTNPISGLANSSGGTATVPLPTFCSYQPDFVTTAQTNAVYVANYGQENGTNCNLASTDSVAALNTGNNTVSNIKYLPAGSHPVLMAETPNALNLYVANQGDGINPATVMNLSPVDLSTIATIPIGVNPSWIATRPDGQRIYVVTQGDGQLYTIRADNTVVLPSQSVGVGANYVLYDKSLNRLYVTSPAATTNSNGFVYVYSASTATDSPAPLATPPSNAGNPPGALTIPPVPPCATAPATCGPVIPVSVAALPDGSRFYVASYQRQSPCSDPNIGTGPCIIPMVTVFDAGSLTIRTPSSSLFGAELSLLAYLCPPGDSGTCVSPFGPGQYAVPEVGSCAPATVYTPVATRFRMFATASADSSHVYVSICDAGAIADVSTTTNTLNQGTNADDRLVIDLLAPFSAAAPGPNNQPPPQSPVFLLTGQ
jgi:hypothetical protein